MCPSWGTSIAQVSQSVDVKTMLSISICQSIDATLYRYSLAGFRKINDPGDVRSRTAQDHHRPVLSNGKKRNPKKYQIRGPWTWWTKLEANFKNAFIVCTYFSPFYAFFTNVMLQMLHIFTLNLFQKCLSGYKMETFYFCVLQN